jgi:small GTP-binding protein
MLNKPLKLAVVGHTNVGKTSLLRTLTRDSDFGEVSHRPSTTRHVQGARLSVAGKALLELYDTPGLEDAIDLLDYLERLERPGERLDGPARLARFLEGSEARQRFEQEAKVLRQLLASDAGLYVIDAREPVLAKYRDELAVLAGTGKPLLPVLNFVAQHAHREAEWREALARLGLHALVRFDTVAPPLDGERRLYESLALLLENARPALERLIADHEQQRLARAQSAARLIAELLLDCAACRRSVATAGAAPFAKTPNRSAPAYSEPADLEPAYPDSAQAEPRHSERAPTGPPPAGQHRGDEPRNDAQQRAISELRAAIRRREQRCVEALLRLYAFRPAEAAAGELPLLDGRWGDDLFNPETLRQLGVKIGGGLAAGAAAGAGIDLLVGGITLGAATVLGALAGGALQTARSYGGRLLGKFKGHRELTVDDAVLRLLALRQRQLLHALQARGHGALGAIQLAAPEPRDASQASPTRSAIPASAQLPATQKTSEKQADLDTQEARAAQDKSWRQGKLPRPLHKARAHPEWSSLNPGAQLEQTERHLQLELLVRDLTESPDD